MDIVLTNFWLICGLWVGGFGALYNRHKMLKNIHSTEISLEEVNAFTKGWALALIIPSIILWVLQLSSGPAKQPFFTTWPSPQKWIATGVIVLSWVSLLYWVWLGKGAQRLSRMALLARSNYPKYFYSPVMIKMYSILAVAVGLFSLSMQLAK